MLFDDAGFEPSTGLGFGGFQSSNAWHGRDFLAPTLPTSSSSSAAFAHEFLLGPFRESDNTELTPTTMSASESSAPIVITKYVTSDPTDGFGDPGGAEEQEFSGIPADGGGGGYSDEQVREIVINVNRPLTDSEKAAIQHLQATITAIDSAIRALADNAVLRLPNGVNVTGAQLKAIWAKTDFVINENEPYRNLSYRGEADVIGQDTQNVSANDYQISFNIHERGLDGYDGLPGGMNYLVAHELGHITQWWTPNFDNEQMANDIGRAILASDGLAYLPNPNGDGYSTSSPMQFSTS